MCMIRRIRIDIQAPSFHPPDIRGGFMRQVCGVRVTQPRIDQESLVNFVDLSMYSSVSPGIYRAVLSFEITSNAMVFGRACSGVLDDVLETSNST